MIIEKFIRTLYFSVFKKSYSTYIKLNRSREVTLWPYVLLRLGHFGNIEMSQLLLAVVYVGSD